MQYNTICGTIPIIRKTKSIVFLFARHLSLPSSQPAVDPEWYYSVLQCVAVLQVCCGVHVLQLVCCQFIT